MRIATTVCAAVLAAAPTSATATTAAPATVQQKSWHTNERIGFKFRPIKGWEEIPIKVGERWLVGKYMADKTYFYTDKRGGWTWEYKPELNLIAFYDEDADSDAEEDDEKKDEDDAKDKPKIRVLGKSYKDYEDYLDRTYKGGGFYIASREEKQLGDISATCYEIKVEKLTTLTGPKRIITWVFDLPDVDVAVQYEITEGSYKKLKSKVHSSLKSFKVIPRTGGFGQPDASIDPGWITLFDMETGTPEERKQKRMESVAQHRAKVLNTLPDGWTAKQVGSCFVLNHVDDKYAKKVVAQCEGLMGWLDETFPFVGPDEYVREPILRICDSSEEEWSFRKGGDGWYWTGIEIVTHKDRDGWNDWENEWTNTQILSLWFRDRDRDLWFALPSWLSHGLNNLVEGARAKGRGVEFRSDDWDRDRVRKLLREGKVSRPRELVMMTKSQFQSGGSSWNRRKEAGAFLRFLIEGAGAKHRLTRDVLPTYMRNLSIIIEGSDDPIVAAKPKEFASEEAEEEWYKSRKQALQSREQKIVEDAWFRTFRGWSDRDWNAIEKLYFDSID